MTKMEKKVFPQKNDMWKKELIRYYRFSHDPLFLFWPQEKKELRPTILLIARYIHYIADCFWYRQKI